MGLIPLEISLLPTTNLFELACIPLTSMMPSRGDIDRLEEWATMNFMKCNKVQGLAAGLGQSPISLQAGW